MQLKNHARKRSVLALKPGADVTGSPKQRYQWVHYFFKKIISYLNCGVICLAEMDY